MTDKQAPQHTPDEIEEFVMWAAEMATDFVNGKSWRTGQFRDKLNALITAARIADLRDLAELAEPVLYQSMLNPRDERDAEGIAVSIGYIDGKIDILEATLTNDKIGGEQ